jgi:hypothetical protein
MAKTVKFTSNVHLSAKFGGIEHGEKTGDVKKGTLRTIKSDELADHLIENDLAEELSVEAAEEAEKAAPLSKTEKKAAQKKNDPPAA